MIAFILATLCHMEIAQIIAELTSERNRIDQAITALEGPRRGRGRPRKMQPSRAASGRRPMGPAARKRIAAAMKLSWAKRVGKSASPKSAPPTKRVRGPMSPAMRRKMSVLMKQRWAATKKAGAKSL